MSSHQLIKTLLRSQNEVLLKGIAEKFELDSDELFAKYLRPSFYLPVPVATNNQVVMKEQIPRLKRKTHNNARNDAGTRVSRLVEEDH